MATTRRWVVHLRDVPDQLPVDLAHSGPSFPTRKLADEYCAVLDQGYDWCISEVIITAVVETRPYNIPAYRNEVG